MRATSLWQPWASAIALGAKRVETRHWPTSYRGKLAIHAAKRCVAWEMLGFDTSRIWRAALDRIGDKAKLQEVIPFGAVVAVCNLVDCLPSEAFLSAELDRLRFRKTACGSAHWEWTERDMGDFSPGRFGWILEDVRQLPEPIPWKGSQGFFDVPDEVIYGKAPPGLIAIWQSAEVLRTHGEAQ